jgi:ferric-dicitrate binding protein FerR (iron transport regulator)
MIQESDLLRLIEGECTPDEAAAIQAWIAADPPRGELLDGLRAVWCLTGDSTRRWDLAEARERLFHARGVGATPGSAGFPLGPRATAPLKSVPAGPAPVSRRRSISRGRAVWPARVAAAVALLIAGGAVWHFLPPRAAYREYATGPGQRLTLSFADGSRVLLSVGSRLRVPRDYGVRERAVELEGEAYFTVRHDPRRPFLVRTQRGTTEDRGTAFAVRAYREERYLQVVVTSGRVALRGARHADSVLATLRPRDRAVIDSAGDATVAADAPVEQYLAWTRGRLVFTDAPLSSVISELERWYDVDIQTGDRSLDDERVTISFATESVGEALSALAKVLNTRVMRTDRLVRLIPVRPRQ